jgi:hypothetical protein
MKKIVFAFCMIIFHILNLYCDQVNNYSLELIKTFGVGNNENTLGYASTRERGPGDEPGPSAYNFYNNNLYVMDSWNSCIKKFDKNFNLLENFNNLDLYQPWKIEVDNFENFNVLYSSGIIKIDKNGNKIFYIDFKRRGYEIKADPLKSIIMDNIIYIFMNDGSLKYIKDPGLDAKANAKKIKDISELNLNDSSDNASTRVMSSSDTSEVKIENGVIIKDSELFIRDFEKYLHYKQTHRTAPETRTMQTVKSNTSRDVNEFLKPGFINTYLGKDQDGNVYWDANSIVLVLNPDGVMIDAFTVDQNKVDVRFPAIHPSGDVYFMGYDPEGVYLYKVKRVW